MSSPLFIVGEVHSGTTLLKWILASSPDHYVGSGESALFSRMPTIRGLYPDLRDEEVLASFCAFVVRCIESGYVETYEDLRYGRADPRQVVRESVIVEMAERIRGTTDHVSAAVEIFRALAERDGKSWFIEKTPAHLFWIEEILAAVPEARVIEIVRDPRGVLASRRRRRLRKRAESAYHPVWDALGWRAAERCGAAASRRHPGRVHRVCYEDLVEDREAFMSSLGSAIGVPFRSEMMDVGLLNATAAEDGRRKKAVDVSEAWRQELPGPDRAICQALCREEMQNWGYEVVPVATADRARQSWLYLTAAFEFVFRFVYRVRRVGWGGAVNVAVNYLRRLENLRASRSGTMS